MTSTDDSAMEEGRLEENFSIAWFRGALDGLRESERKLQEICSPGGVSLRTWQFEMCIYELERARAENDALKQQHWISCEVKMPPEDTVVLVYNGYMCTAIWKTGKFFDSDDSILHPTHWTLLPNPPEIK